MRLFIIMLVLDLGLALSASAGTKVAFRADGICLVNGKPFFPIGCWVYNLDSAVMADLRAHHFNTVVGNGFVPGDLPLVEQQRLMGIPMASDEFVKAAKASPALLAWYLTDEPEEHGETTAQVHARYLALKAKDADHPIGITHDMLSGPPKYKGSCDFTMTDVYPVTRDRDWPLKAVGEYTDGPRQVHGNGWPNFTFIQTFGGPDADGGKWAQPLPLEVRFMAFDALVHRADGILYFSYWPRAAETWTSIAQLNRDIERLAPWLVADGSEAQATSSDAAIEIRAKKVKAGWMVLAVNTESRTIDTRLTVDLPGAVTLRMPFEAGDVKASDGTWPAHFSAHEAKAYLAGDEPRQ